MFQKIKTKRRIKQCKKIILATEKKRARSQAALVEAILSHVTPNDEDVNYFNEYTKVINKYRDEMHECENLLKKSDS